MANDQVLLGENEKGFLKANIFVALDSVTKVQGENATLSNKVVISQIENMIYNIAQFDYL